MTNEWQSAAKSALQGEKCREGCMTVGAVCVAFRSFHQSIDSESGAFARRARSKQMARQLAPVKPEDIETVKSAITHLRKAREDLKRARAPQSAKKVRSALKSAEGALRHVYRRLPN